MKNEKYLHSELTSKILEVFYQVFNKVGFGFEKRVYVKSLAKALKNLELKNETNKEVSIYFSGDEVGKIKIDIFVDNKVLAKVTNHDEIENRDAEILQNELRMSEIQVGLLLNFGRTPEQKRRVNLTDNS